MSPAEVLQGNLEATHEGVQARSRPAAHTGLPRARGSGGPPTTNWRAWRAPWRRSRRRVTT